MKLYGYWRSSAAYRVRIALNLKAVACEQVAVNLLQGEHRQAAYRAINPLGLVPTLELDDGRQLGQSTAIIQWLDEAYPQPPLLPEDSFARAQVLSMAYTVACEIHPLNNLGVLNYLKAELGATEQQTQDWMHAWFARGFTSLEASVGSGPYCFGYSVTMADIFLVPMIYNALRFNYDMANLHPRLLAIYQTCITQVAFSDASPEKLVSE